MTFKASSWPPPVKNITPCVSGPARNPRGANRPVAAQTMSAKIAPMTRNSLPNPVAPPTSGSTKPAHTWPKPIGSLPSDRAPPK
jgi:hypothetical protein